MVPRLHKANSGKTLPVGVLHNRLHKLPPDTLVLDVRINGDGTNAGDTAALVKKIAADDPAIELGDDAVEAGTCDQHRKEACGNLRTWEVRRKVVCVCDSGECLVAD